MGEICKMVTRLIQAETQGILVMFQTIYKTLVSTRGLYAKPTLHRTLNITNLDSAPKTKMFVTCMIVYHRTLRYGAQAGLYTITGRWNAFSGDCGRGFTSAVGVVSCRTTSACWRLSRRVCAGDINRCASQASNVSADVDVGTIQSPPSWV